MTTPSIASNLQDVRNRIASAALRSGRSAQAVRFVLVTKTIWPDRVREAIRAGATDLGENKVQEGLGKAEVLAGEDARWSMIGHLQTNKVRDALRFASEVQSLDRLSLAAELDKRLQQVGRGMDMLVQVITSGEASKFGLKPEQVAGFLRALKPFASLRPRGFMTLATFTPEETEVRRCFRVLHEIRDRARNDAPRLRRCQAFPWECPATFRGHSRRGHHRPCRTGRVRPAHLSRLTLLARRCGAPVTCIPALSRSIATTS